MSESAEHSTFIKTPQQLIVVILLSFIVPIIGIILVVQLVVSKPVADPSALSPEAVAARLQPVGKVEVGAPAAAPGARSGEELVKAACGACHVPGIANAPKIGDKGQWGQVAKQGFAGMLASVVKGKGAMPPRGGAADATDTELARAIVFMANQSGQALKEPAGKPAAGQKK